MDLAILAAGKGERLQTVFAHKPLVKINGISLLEHTLRRPNPPSCGQLTIIFNESAKEELLINLPRIKEISDLRIVNIGLHIIYKDTSSSLHSLHEIIKLYHQEKIKKHIVVSMIDTLVPLYAYRNFLQYLENLHPHQSCIMTTPFIDDENPLTLSTDNNNLINQFQLPLQQAKLITSGIYCFSPIALSLVEQAIGQSIYKMRNFLAYLLKQGQQIYSFKVDETLDIDRPSDIKLAEQKYFNRPLL